uniref:Uncharacterized protein n=1 Tax=Syphacia muris TaxID=451379 RepID=A0A0N5AYZ2_9BILA
MFVKRSEKLLQYSVSLSVCIATQSRLAAAEVQDTLKLSVGLEMKSMIVLPEVSLNQVVSAADFHSEAHATLLPKIVYQIASFLCLIVNSFVISNAIRFQDINKQIFFPLCVIPIANAFFEQEEEYSAKNNKKMEQKARKECSSNIDGGGGGGGGGGDDDDDDDDVF